MQVILTSWGHLERAAPRDASFIRQEHSGLDSNKVRYGLYLSHLIVSPGVYNPHRANPCDRQLQLFGLPHGLYHREDRTFWRYHTFPRVAAICGREQVPPFLLFAFGGVEYSHHTAIHAPAKYEQAFDTS